MYMQAKRHVVILGGGYAGLIAAARAARAGDGVEVTLINAGAHFVQRIRMHELLAGGQPRTTPIAPLLHRRGVHFVEGYVDHVDPARQRLEGRTSAGNVWERGYDELVIALGSRTAARVPGVAEHALRLNDPSAIQEAAGQLRHITNRSGRVLVVGGGLTAIETATELAARWPSLRVSLSTSGRLGSVFAPAAAARLYARMAQLRVEVHEGTSVAAVEADRAVLADGNTLGFDLCVWCGGFETSPIGRAAGLTVDPYGRIVVDAMLRSIVASNIFAVGDAAAATTNGRAIRMGCVSALPMGAHTGDNIRRLVRGVPLKPFAMDFVLRCISLGPGDGLAQWTEPDDAPRAAVWTHRRGAVLKEAICRMTYQSVVGELRLGLPLYLWPGAHRAAKERDVTRGHLPA